ncbi:hypothetical protein GCM10028771_15940 [Nocardioides marmoraquaticus]
MLRGTDGGAVGGGGAPAVVLTGRAAGHASTWCTPARTVGSRTPGRVALPRCPRGRRQSEGYDARDRGGQGPSGR